MSDLDALWDRILKIGDEEARDAALTLYEAAVKLQACESGLYDDLVAVLETMIRGLSGPDPDAWEAGRD